MTAEELNAALDLTCKTERLQGRLDDLRETQVELYLRERLRLCRAAAGRCLRDRVAAELEIEIAGLRKRREIKQIVIKGYIEKFDPEDVERKLMRYVECRLWKLVSASIRYSRSHAYQLHVEILKKTGLDRIPPDL